MHPVTPKKRLGQHFLKDMNIARKIVGSVSANADFIMEIGPGTGVLTGLLIQDNKNFIAIDVDKESIDYLKSAYPGFAENMVCDDFLKSDIQKLLKDKTCILGNFPYNISSQIFFRILENRNKVNEVVCMLQKEVAERICEGPGSKTYGILSVLLQTFYEIKLLFTVSENVFIPPPKVKSAVISLKRNERKSLPCDDKLFFLIVKKAFNQRRKMLRNSLKDFNITGLDDKILIKRPEQLSVEDFINIAVNIKMI